jgi:hypothetical protein
VHYFERKYLLITIHASCPFPCHEGIQGSTDIPPRILTLGIRWTEWSVSRLRSFTPWSRTPVPTEKRFGGTQNQSGLFGEEKNLLPLLGFKSQTVKPIAQSLY